MILKPAYLLWARCSTSASARLTLETFKNCSNRQEQTYSCYEALPLVGRCPWQAGVQTELGLGGAALLASLQQAANKTTLYLRTVSRARPTTATVAILGLKEVNRSPMA